MGAIEIIVTVVYIISLLYLFLFSICQIHLTWIYISKKEKQDQEPFMTPPEFQPNVTIQLPVYNEKYVIERLIDAIAGLHYPKEKIEIQVLDDSTDETTSIIQQKIQSLPLSVNIKHIHRSIRAGFKAGALEHGLPHASGEFIAIFDADFIPNPDFLNRTLPYFGNEQTGAVQTRWGHLNKDYSLLTQLQAFGLDAHFCIEQSGRYLAGSFINFNGTGGVWRKKCIEEAGGWSADTLTEDLDLSYRAQLKGWQLYYLENVVTPGELPVIMPVIKSQQHRWNKGGAETGRKMFMAVLAADIPFQKKFHAFFHLFNSTVFIALILAAVASVPMLFVKQNHPEVNDIFKFGIFLFIGFLSVSIFYWTATKAFYQKPAQTFFKMFPLFLIVTMGLSFHNAIAVLEGLFGYKTPFVRTPKFNVAGKKNQWKANAYYRPRLDLVTVLEGLLCLYFIFGIITGIRMNDTGLLLFHGMLALGFGLVFIFSISPLAYARSNS